MNVIDQIRTAVAPGNRLAALMGLLLGGFVPLAAFWVAHHEGAALTAEGARSAALVAGGLAYSAKTVFQWARMAFDNGFKALGFVVLLEGVMVTAQTHWLTVAALCYLIAINAVATACALARQSQVKPTWTVVNDFEVTS